MKEKGKSENEAKKVRLHELPYTEIVKSGTILKYLIRRIITEPLPFLPRLHELLVKSGTIRPTSTHLDSHMKYLMSRIITEPLPFPPSPYPPWMGGGGG